MRQRIPKEAEGMLLRSYLRGQLGLSTRTLSKLKAAEQGILLDGARVTVRAVLHAGSVLELAVEDTASDENSAVLPAPLPVELLYEDAFLWVVNKPAGMPTHPTHGHFCDTLANALAYRQKQKGEPFVFRAVNRLDRDTSGVVLVAKDRVTADKLAKQLQAGEIQKEYLAMLSAMPPAEAGILDRPIRRVSNSIILREVSELPDALPAKTAYRIVEPLPQGGAVAWVQPFTGRTHQIRVHFASIGCPLLGDSLYGGKRDLIERQALHALRLTFRHPQTGEPITVTAPPPPDFSAVWKGGAPLWQDPSQ